jgi:hypothetical protein
VVAPTGDRAGHAGDGSHRHITKVEDAGFRWQAGFGRQTTGRLWSVARFSAPMPVGFTAAEECRAVAARWAVAAAVFQNFCEVTRQCNGRVGRN